uniref:Uncharacterized protein n=1 Tax=Setaria viridis TaxID=4556 RepID=A0A4U6UKJ9_SETVI|nr:hypothetical protein SEVIR_5G188800v2 [Setaria viridis]
MSCFLHGAALAFAKVLGHTYNLKPYTGLLPAFSILSARGHLSLTRARPGLRKLNALLTPEAFLLDAAHALGTAALRHRPISGRLTRMFRDLAPKLIAKSSVEDADRAEAALNALAQIAAESPRCTSTLVSAAAICDLIGLVNEGDEWITKLEPTEASTIPARAPTIRTSSPCLRMLNDALRERVHDGDMSVFKKVLIGELLKRMVKRKYKDLALKRDGISCDLPAGIDLQDSGPRVRPDRYTVAASFLKTSQSQALLSTLVLGALPLSGACIRSALRVAERDLARATEEGDAPTVADLRLLAALLSSRDGRLEDALERYAEMARDDPSDPRPHFHVGLVCALAGKKAEHDKWLARCASLGDALKTLKEELVIAVVLGGTPVDFDEESTPLIRLVVGAAAKRVDAALISALRDKNMSRTERLEVRAVCTFLYAGIWSALKKLKGHPRSQ